MITLFVCWAIFFFLKRSNSRQWKTIIKGKVGSPLINNKNALCFQLWKPYQKQFSSSLCQFHGSLRIWYLLLAPKHYSVVYTRPNIYVSYDINIFKQWGQVYASSILFLLSSTHINDDYVQQLCLLTAQGRTNGWSAGEPVWPVCGNIMGLSSVWGERGKGGVEGGWGGVTVDKRGSEGGAVCD